jgi:hypothetical protein
MMGDETRGLLQEAHSIRRQAERLSDLDGAAAPGSVTSGNGRFHEHPGGRGPMRPRSSTPRKFTWLGSSSDFSRDAHIDSNFENADLLLFKRR